MLILQAILGLLAAVGPPQRATPEEAAMLAGQLRTLVLQLLPDPLYTDDKKWNLQKKGPLGKLKNDGRWVKVRITPKAIDQTLRLTIDDMIKDKARKTFTINLSFDAQIDLERQTWATGVRLYSGSTRARMRVKMALNCELLTRVEKSASWLPDMIVRLHVLSSSFGHDHVVVEHTAGVGGDAARVLGDLMLGVVKQAKPSLERKLIEKANAAVVKAGDTKEIRVSLADWLNGKPAKK
jgi:hypothetical protein